MTDENIVNFTGAKNAPSLVDIEELVEKVESIVKRIRSGEVVAIAYALVKEDGYTTGAHRLPGVHSAQVSTAAFGLALDAMKVDEE